MNSRNELLIDLSIASILLGCSTVVTGLLSQVFIISSIPFMLMALAIVFEHSPHMPEINISKQEALVYGAIFGALSGIVGGYLNCEFAANDAPANRSLFIIIQRTVIGGMAVGSLLSLALVNTIKYKWQIGDQNDNRFWLRTSWSLAFIILILFATLGAQLVETGLFFKTHFPPLSFIGTGGLQGKILIWHIASMVVVFILLHTLWINIKTNGLVARQIFFRSSLALIAWLGLLAVLILANPEKAYLEIEQNGAVRTSLWIAVLLTYMVAVYWLIMFRSSNKTDQDAIN